MKKIISKIALVLLRFLDKVIVEIVPFKRKVKRPKSKIYSKKGKK